MPADLGLKLKNVSLSAALRHITASVGMKFVVEPFAVVVRANDDTRGPPPVGRELTSCEKRMEKIVFPQVQFQNASLEEAVEFIRVSRGCLDTTNEAPLQWPVNYVIKVREKGERPLITLDLHEISMGETLRYVAEISRTKLRFDPFAVMITDDGDVRPRLVGNVPADKASIILPEIQLASVTLDEAIEFISIKSLAHDPKKAGVRITVKASGDPKATFDLWLKSIPVAEALRYIAELSGHVLSFDGRQYILIPDSGR